jgi:trigger factor
VVIEQADSCPAGRIVGVAAGDTHRIVPEEALPTPGDKDAAEATAKSVAAPAELTIDDAFAKTLGLETLAKLKGQVRERIARGHAAASHAKVKRALLDALDKAHKFEVPPSLVEQEFSGIWATVIKEIETSGKSFADEGTTEEKAREEYRVIADRRVRLGLVIAEIGEKSGIKVTDDELTRAVTERARQYPGREQEVFDQYRRNPDAIASLRAPIFEDKVVDYVLELSKVAEKKVSREALYGEDEETAKRGESQE